MNRDEIERLVRAIDTIALHRYGRTMLRSSEQMDYQEQMDWKILGTLGVELADARDRAQRGDPIYDLVLEAHRYQADYLKNGLVVPSRREILREVASMVRRVHRSFTTVGLGDPLVRGEDNGWKLP